MCPKQSFGLVVLHMTSYANVLTYCWSRSPPLNVIRFGRLRDELRWSLPCVKFMLFFGCYRILWTSLLANCLYLRGMLRIACGQNIEETEVQEIFYIIKESNLQEGSPLIPPLF